MRSTARKVKIEDLVKGSYTQTPEGEPNHLETPWEQQLLRVNIMATVVDTFVRDDGGYATLHLDDGSETIRAKAWSEDVEEMEEFEVGDLITVIGKVREYEGEIHLVPEIIREVEDPNWELVRELEILDKRKKMLEEGIEPEYEEEEEEPGMKTEEIEITPASEKEIKTEEESKEIGTVEDLGETSEAEEDEGPEVSEEKKEELLLALDKLEGEDGAEISDLADEIQEDTAKTEEIIGALLNEDKVYEPIAGRFKRLG